LGEDSLQNDERKKNLSKELHAVYVGKFIEQTYYVFNGSRWGADDLNFIRNEYQALQRSDLLKIESGSPADDSFREIRDALNKYDEIVNHIHSCRSFSAMFNGERKHRFPTQAATDKIKDTRTYLNNGLQNKYVNKCTRLHDELKEIPQAIFRTHVRFLDSKVSAVSILYKYSYSTFNAYLDDLYLPMKREIDELNNDNYRNVANFNSEYKKLTDKWDANMNEANKHLRSQ
jgi:hypothetical protein